MDLTRSICFFTFEVQTGYHRPRSHLPHQEHANRKNPCIWTGPASHQRNNCNTSAGCFFVFLVHRQQTHMVQTLIDSGSGHILINAASFKALVIPTQPLETHLKVQAINPGCFHQSFTTFLFWESQVTTQSSYGHSGSRLGTQSQPGVHHIPWPASELLSHHDSALPPWRNQDKSHTVSPPPPLIIWLPHWPAPRHHSSQGPPIPLFLLKERKAMDQYITETLVAGIICPSSSAAGARFFLVGIKIP